MTLSLWRICQTLSQAPGGPSAQRPLRRSQHPGAALRAGRLRAFAQDVRWSLGLPVVSGPWAVLSPELCGSFPHRTRPPQCRPALPGAKDHHPSCGDPRSACTVEPGLALGIRSRRQAARAPADLGPAADPGPAPSLPGMPAQPAQRSSCR